MKKAEHTTAKGQKTMQRRADQIVLDVCKIFNEIQTGPNPLTKAELAELIRKRPERYSILKSFLEKMD